MSFDLDKIEGFAVVDLETTGLHLDKGDRVIQVGIVRTDLNGNITSTWSEYVNPNRKVAGQHIHGITDDVVKNAKPFTETAWEVMHRLENRIIVAHNYDFDGMFLASEFNRAGMNFRPYDTPYFCTQKNAIHFMPKLMQHSLAQCLEEAGLKHIGKPHDAESDAITTAGLLKFYLDMNQNQVLKLVLPQNQTD